MLSDEHWSKLKGMMLQENIYNKRDLRMMVEGMFYRLRVGCPWRDLPSCFLDSSIKCSTARIQAS
jgi:transposase